MRLWDDCSHPSSLSNSDTPCFMSNKTKTPIVTATDIGNACYCPHSLELRLAGKPESLASKTNKDRGTLLHSVQNEYAYGRAAEIKNEASDKRCYIATHLYGLEHPKTQLLRTFRDRKLLPYCSGRVFVKLYYLYSPMLIRICTRHRFINAFISLLVSTLLWFIARRSDDE